MTVSDRATIVPESDPPRATGPDFVAFYEHEFTQAVRFAWLLVRTSAVAEDLAQEAFVSLTRDSDRSTTNRSLQTQEEYRHRVPEEPRRLPPADWDCFKATPEEIKAYGGGSTHSSRSHRIPGSARRCSCTAMR